MRYILLAAVSLCAATAQAQVQFSDYTSALHLYWKMVLPTSYEPFVESYAEAAGDVRATRGTHELDERPRSVVTAGEIASAVKATDEEEPIVVLTEGSAGQYSKEQKAFAFTPFPPALHFLAQPPQTDRQSMPTINLRFLNGTQAKWLPMPESVAKKLLDDASWGYNRPVQVQATAVATQAKPANKEIRATLTEVVVSYPDSVLMKRTGEIARYTFDPRTGTLLTAEYTGTAD